MLFLTSVSAVMHLFPRSTTSVQHDIRMRRLSTELNCMRFSASVEVRVVFEWLFTTALRRRFRSSGLPLRWY